MAGYTLTFDGNYSIGIDGSSIVSIESTTVHNIPNQKNNITTFQFTEDCGATTKDYYYEDKFVYINERTNFDNNVPTYNLVTNHYRDIKETYTLRGWSKTERPSSPYYYYDSVNPQASSIITLTKNTTLYACWEVDRSSPTPQYTFPTKTRSGYKLAGYSTTKIPTSKDGELDVYHPGEVLTVSDYSYTFWEIWVPELSTTTTLKSMGKYSWKTLIENQTNPNYVLYNYGGKESLWGINIIKGGSGTFNEMFSSSSWSSDTHIFTFNRVPTRINSIEIKLEIQNSQDTPVFAIYGLSNPGTAFVEDTTKKYELAVEVKGNTLTLYVSPLTTKVTFCYVSYTIDKNIVTYCDSEIYDKDYNLITETDSPLLGKTYYLPVWE